MLSALSNDDCLGIILVLVVATTLLALQRCRSLYYTLLAHFHGFIALLARTEVFVFFIFLYLVAMDACHAIIRAIKPWVTARLGLSNGPIAQTAPKSTSCAALSHSAPNNQLLAWMDEDAEQARKSRAETRKQEAQSSPSSSMIIYY
jgi:hypothetical protein